MNCWKCRRQFAWPISRYHCCIFWEGCGRELKKNSGDIKLLDQE